MEVKEITMHTNHYDITEINLKINSMCDESMQKFSDVVQDFHEHGMIFFYASQDHFSACVLGDMEKNITTFDTLDAASHWIQGFAYAAEHWQKQKGSKK